jgi:phospholipase/carboxylesterase
MGRLEKIESFGVLMAPLNLSLITQQPTEGFYDSKVFSPAALPLRTFLPVHYEPNYAYPLIVYLHAHGCNEEQVLRYAPHMSRRNYISISLRGMHATMIKKNLKHKNAYTWGPDGSCDAMVEDYIFNAIEKTQDSYNINLNRVFLAGFCEGATLAYRMGFQYPEKFAGILALNGHLPRHQAPLWRVQALKNLPVFMGHGIANSVVTSRSAEKDRDSMILAGMNPFWRTYGTNHRIHAEMLRDANTWIMDKIQNDKKAGRSSFSA